MIECCITNHQKICLTWQPCTPTIDSTSVLCGYLFVSRTLCLFSVLHKERKQTVFVRQDGKSFCLKVIGRRQKINEWIHYIFDLLGGYFSSPEIKYLRSLVLLELFLSGVNMTNSCSKDHSLPPPPTLPPSLSRSFLLMGGGAGASSIRLSAE